MCWHLFWCYWGSRRCDTITQFALSPHSCLFTLNRCLCINTSTHDIIHTINTSTHPSTYLLCSHCYCCWKRPEHILYRVSAAKARWMYWLSIAKPMLTQRKQPNSTQEGNWFAWDSNQDPSCFEVMVLFTNTLCHSTYFCCFYRGTSSWLALRFLASSWLHNTYDKRCHNAFHSWIATDLRFF